MLNEKSKKKKKRRYMKESIFICNLLFKFEWENGVKFAFHDILTYCQYCQLGFSSEIEAP